MRVRLRFAKLGKVRWTSHRDVARMWERALRRAGLPVVRTEGFSPRPKVAFGLALPTGHESIGEYLDVDLAGDTDVTALPALLSPELPVGVDCLAAVEIDSRQPSLQQDVTACVWELELTGLTAADAEAAAVAALAAPAIVASRSRKGHAVTDDVRPAIRTLDVVSGAVACVVAEVATQPRGLRPSELLEACFPAAEALRVIRTHQWIERDGARREPVPLDATSPAHAVRACACA